MSIQRFSEYLTETSLSRVWQHFTDPEQESGIISAWKDTLRPDENAKRTFELAAIIRKAGFGYTFVDGRYQGNEETSIVVVGGKDGRLKGLLRQWRAQFDQHSVLYKPQNTDRVILIYADHEDEIGQFHPNRAGDFMTHLRGRPGSFVFESAAVQDTFFTALGKSIQKKKKGQ